MEAEIGEAEDQQGDGDGFESEQQADATRCQRHRV
jgi:hypothetical protein